MNDSQKAMLTRFIYRAVLIVVFVPIGAWTIGSCAVREFSSFCKFTFYYEPRSYWAEWIDTFRRGQP